MEWTLIYSFAAALIAIINPLGNLPIFISYTSENRIRVKRIIALLVSGTVFMLLIFFLFTGEGILKFFGITLPAFQIAGGILLLLFGIGMIRSQDIRAVGDVFENAERGDFEEAENKFRKIMIPLAVPLFVGPGSISTVILYANKAKNDITHIGLAVIIVFVSFLVLIVLLSGEWIEKYAGKMGLDIATRLLGLILAAIGVQFILEGLSEATINFINLDVINIH